jgi:hypothetical protein
MDLVFSQKIIVVPLKVKRDLGITMILSNGKQFNFYTEKLLIDNQHTSINITFTFLTSFNKVKFLIDLKSSSPLRSINNKIINENLTALVIA